MVICINISLKRIIDVCEPFRMNHAALCKFLSRFDFATAIVSEREIINVRTD
jgi:hypothetical protein